MTDHRSQTDGTGRTRRRSVVIGSMVALLLVVLDQVTKELAESLLERGEFVSLLGDRVGWELVYNQGGAFGIPAPHWIFLIVTVIVVTVVARALPRTLSRVTATAYGMLLAGALGNVIDRIFREGATDAFGGGAVVDFVAWGTFPRFNVADSAITVGFALLVVGLWREERAHADEERAAEALASGAHEGTGAGHVTLLVPDDGPDDTGPGEPTRDAVADLAAGSERDEPTDEVEPREGDGDEPTEDDAEDDADLDEPFRG